MLFKIFAILLGSSIAIFGVAKHSDASDPPDLSKLSDAEKAQGFGQFQVSEPEKKPPEEPTKKPRKPQDDPDEIRRRRAEEDRQRREREQRQRQLTTGTAAGSAALGGVALGRSFNSQLDTNRSNNWGAGANDPNDPNYSSYDPHAYDPQEIQTVDIVAESSQYNLTEHPVPVPTKLRKTHSISVAVESLFFRDFSRLNQPIANGINSSQLGFAGASGIESLLSWRSGSEDDYGLSLGFALADGNDQANVLAVDRLYTTPSIGFLTGPFRSVRETSFATVEGNLFLANSPYQAAVGLRWLHLDDTLENQVLPAGLTHRIATNSDSLLAQFTIQPSIEWKRARLESLFQVGAGVFTGSSTTRLERVVGGPSNVPDDIQTSRTTGAMFFKGQIGVAVPIQKWFAFRGGLQLLAQSDIAQAAGQMAHTDFVQQKYHLRTESLVLGALFCGIELRR